MYELLNVEVAAGLWDKHGFIPDPMETGRDGRACLVAILAADAGVDIVFDSVYDEVADYYGLTIYEVNMLENGFMGLTSEESGELYTYGKQVAERVL